MDNNSQAVADSFGTSPPCNGSARRGSPLTSPGMAVGRPASLMDQVQGQLNVVRVVVHRDDHGYGMKVSGDNPVYVQSVKEGGAAERAGLHAGDKIIKVNGVNVEQSTHIEVVALIKSSREVVLTVKQRMQAQRAMGSPSLHNRPATVPSPSSQRITGPQPVDNETQCQLLRHREKQYRLMIEKEQRYLDQLRSEMATSRDDSKSADLAKTERNLNTLQTELLRIQAESPNPTHHRTKSSPDSLFTLGNADNARKLSESMNDLTRQEGWEGETVDVTPPGTPPPPYPSPRMNRRDRNSNNMDEGDNSFDEHLVDGSSPEVLLFRGVGSTNSRVLANSSPIHAANSQVPQQPIRSMEDDELSDQEISELENHGHFKSLSLLWEHLPHLAVFTNYVLSNSEPNSLLFYLLTDLYKEGNAAKDMRKWAFEIHSCFLVPGAPLRLGNVDENIAREIDDVLTREYEKEEILRKIFWKARSRAKEELTRQLTYFQQNRTRGLGTIFGPTDQELNEVYHDKAKEQKLYESLFLAKLEPYLDEFEKEQFDPKRYYTAAALTTVMTRIFQLRPTSHALDRCPVFVNREKSFRNKFIGKYTKKINVLNHQYIAQPYYTVIVCNYCHQIIYGIAPQGYQCSACLINLHRQCVRLYDDHCPGPIKKKDRGITQWMRPDRGEHNRFKKTSHFIQTEKDRRQMEEHRDNSFELNECESKPGHPVSRSGSDRRPDAVREEAHHHRHQDSDTSNMEGVQSAGDNDKSEGATPDSSISLPVTGNKRKVNSNINRSESVKEQSEKRKQRRNISDPSHNTSCDVDLDRQQTNFAKNTDSGSSSNSNVSCNGRLSESPSNSVDVHHASLRTNSESDSDMDGEAYPLTWQQLLPEEEVKNLSDYEKKRQDVINELFHTEGSHVRNLKVLYKIFYRRLQQSQILKPDDLNLIFPNIKEMLDIHTEINKEMRRIRKEDPLVKESLGDALVKLFCGTQGEALQQAAATFCERQQLALEFIKKRRERDSKFDTLLSECEKKRQCRRLPLQGIVPTEMQRLSKYPLLLDRLISSTEKDCTQTEELAKLKRVHQMSKEILNYVNESAKIAHNKHRLEEIQSHLDPSMFERADHSIVNEFRNFDLKRYRLLLEGSMQLRRPNKALVPVHVLLMEEMAVILHKDGDSFLMKFFQSGSSAQPTPLSPIIKMSTLLVRRNAVCKNALFILSTSANTSQMYDLIAEDETKREWWYKHFTDAYESYNKREGKPSKRPPAGVSVGAAAAETESESEPEVPPTPGAADLSDRAEAATATVVDESGSDGERVAAKKDDADEAEGRDDVGGGGDLDGSLERAESEEPEMIGGGDEKIKVTAEEWPLIQPSQVNVAIPPVHTAETTLTPLEQIRRKDALVKQTLAEKEGLVADMLSIPREDFHHIADMATADVASGGGHLTERLLASIFQVNQLQKAVNASLDVTESEVIMAKGGKHPACASQEAAAPQQDRSVIPIVPVSLVSEIAASLSSQLTTLLSEVKEVVKERDMLRREFDKVKERLHEEHNLHSPVQYEECNSDESGPEIFSEAATGEHQ